MSFLIPDAALMNNIAILGKTGSGKTTVIKDEIEHIVPPGARVCILDPIKSDYWGLTSSANGKRPGLPFQILGGSRGHVPLHPSSGAAVAEIVASGALPLSILDMSDFEGAGDHSRFFVDFAKTLFKKIRGVVHLVIDEAHIFAPKERTHGEESFSVFHAKRLATAGRTKGIRLIVATQRIQELHNAVLGSCETMVAMRFTFPADQKPVMNWLKDAIADKTKISEVEDSLSKLKKGEAWLCSGELELFERVQFPICKTFDNTKTPDGEEKNNAPKLAPVNVEKLRAILGNAVIEAEASDPKKLKEKLAAANAEIQKLQKAKPPAPPVASPAKIDDKALHAARQEGIAEGYRVGWSAADRDAWDRAVMAMAKVYQHAMKNIEIPFPEFVAMAPQRVPKAPSRDPIRDSVISADVIRATVIRPDVPFQNAGANIPKGEMAILILINDYAPVARDQLTILSGYTASSRDTYIQKLSAKGFIQISSIGISPTPEGIEALPSNYEPLPKGDALREMWMRKLPAGEQKTLAVICAAYPLAIDRERISAETGYTRSSCDTYLQKLKARRLWEKIGKDVRASEALFG